MIYVILLGITMVFFISIIVYNLSSKDKIRKEDARPPDDIYPMW